MRLLCCFPYLHSEKVRGIICDKNGRDTAPLLESGDGHRYAHRNAITQDLMNILRAHTDVDLSERIDEYISEYIKQEK